MTKNEAKTFDWQTVKVSEQKS